MNKKSGYMCNVCFLYIPLTCEICPLNIPLREAFIKKKKMTFVILGGGVKNI